jgi:DNA polymerase III subunit delta'
VGHLRTRGHPVAVAAVRRAIDQGGAPHALLLVGPDGCGKTTLALDLAAGLFCLQPDPANRPCGTCASCHKVEHGNHPDLHRLAPEGAGGQIRLGAVQALIGELALVPMEGALRVSIIEDAQRLNPDAQNGLLKALEEPVGRTCICLLADDDAALLPTLVSRTARLRMGVLPTHLVANLLVERGLADPAAARAIAARSGGRPGLAVQLAGEPASALAESRLSRELLDLMEADRRSRLDAAGSLIAAAAAGAQPETSPARGSAGGSRRRLQPAERRAAVLHILDAWRSLSRDLALVAAGADPSVRELDLLEDLRGAARGLHVPDLLRFLRRLDDLSAALEAYANPELALDALLLAWPRPIRLAA